MVPIIQDERPDELTSSPRSNSLPSLSKCRNLRHLDLFLISANIPLPELKKAIQDLPKLTTLKLPKSSNLRSIDASMSANWPPNLTTLQLSGKFDPETIATFPWPLHLTDLILTYCRPLDANGMSSLLSNPQLGQRLKRLTVTPHDTGMDYEAAEVILPLLPELIFLSIPESTVYLAWFEIAATLNPPVALTVLELGWGDTESCFDFQDVARALEGGLANLRAIYVDERVDDDELMEIDSALVRRWTSQHPDAGPEATNDVGVHFLTDEHRMYPYHSRPNAKKQPWEYT